MTGTDALGAGALMGAGTSSPAGVYCGHDEAELRRAAGELEGARTDVQDAMVAIARAEAAAWVGPAAEGFRRSTAGLGARLAALGAALGALALVVAALQSEAAACPGVPAGPSSRASAAGPGLAVEGRSGPLLPVASRQPPLHLPAPSAPVFARGHGSAAAGEVCR